MKKTLIRDFTQGNITKQLFIFATPLLMSNLLQIMYNMIDMLVVGRSLGEVGLSAVSIGGDVSKALTFFAMGFSNASQVLIAQYIGANRREEIGRFLGTVFTFVTMVSLTLTAICFALRTQILQIMNTPAESYDQTLAYATISILGLSFVYGYNFVGAILRGLGDSKHPFMFISFAAILNIILDIVLVFGLKMGAAGAAIATVFSQGISFLSCVYFLYRNSANLGFSMKRSELFHIDFGMLGTLVSLGLPMALKSASVQFSKLFMNSWINSYGITVSAFAGVANKIASTGNLISNAFNTAGSSMVGQNLSAGKTDRVKQLLKRLYIIAITLNAGLYLILISFPVQIFGFFKLNEEGISIGLQYLPIAGLMLLGCALRCPNNALINGSGNVTINFLTAILDGIVLRIGFGLFFGLVLDMKYLGFWLGDGVAGFTPFVLGTIFLLSGRWKTAKIKKK